MIYNQMGQLILKETNANMSNTLDVSDFSRGVFSIQMLNSNGELRAIQNVVKL